MKAVEQNFPDPADGLTDEAFLRNAYLALLGRPVDFNGARDYSTRLRAGAPRAQIWRELSASEEARRFTQLQSQTFSSVAVARGGATSVNDLMALDGVEFVREAYRAILGRDPDVAAQRDFSLRLAAGWRKEQVLADLRGDPERTALASPVSGLDDLVKQVQDAARFQDLPSSVDELLALHGETFLKAAYLILFRREADPQGLERYLELLRSGASTMYVLSALYQSPEAKERSAELSGLARAVKRYEIAQRRSWKGWYHRHVLGAPSDLPGDREWRSLMYRLLERT